VSKAGAVLALLVLVLAGCGAANGHDGPASGSSASSTRGPSLAALRRAADLAACPHPAGQTGRVADSGASTRQHLPALRLPCLGGGAPVRLAALRGKPMLVNIWATWCGQCQREVPLLHGVFHAAHGRIRVLGVVDVDDSASALDFAAHAGMHYPSVVDKQGMLLRDVGGRGLPVTLFVSGDGQIVHTRYGPFTSDRQIRRSVHHYLDLRL
jgi:thiol-disulfide isomerase/thioredoxin